MDINYLSESKNDINRLSDLLKEYKRAFSCLEDVSSIKYFYEKIKIPHLEIDTLLNKYKYLQENKINDDVIYIQNKLNSDYINGVSSIFQNSHYFELMKNIKYEDKEDKFLKELFINRFIDNAIHLSPQEKEEFNNLKIKQIELENQFSKNISVFKKENIYILKDELFNSLSDKDKSLFKELNGYYYVSFDNHLQKVANNCDNKEIRLALYDIQNKMVPENDILIKKIIENKNKVCGLLGYSSVGDLVFSKDTYMNNKEEAFNFINKLRSKIKLPLKEEIKKLLNYINVKEGNNKKLSLSDIPESIDYYKIKYKKDKFNYIDGSEKEYFNFEDVVNSVFSLVKDIYGIDIVINNKINDVFICDIFDGKEKKGDVLLDLFERDNKKAGARCFVIKKGSIDQEGTYYISSNLPKDHKMGFNDIKTLLHETGHLIHHVSTKTKYPDYSGTVFLSRDTVEIPSMMLEKFYLNKDFLNNASKGKIDFSIVENFKKSNSFSYASFLARQSSISKMDLEVFSNNKNKNPNEIYSKISNEIGLFVPSNNSFNNLFTHVYSGVYNSGYYGYMLSDVIATNLYSKINKNKKVAIDFKEKVLSKGSLSGFRESFDNFNKDKPNIKEFIDYNIVKRDKNNLHL